MIDCQSIIFVCSGQHLQLHKWIASTNVKPYRQSTREVEGVKIVSAFFDVCKETKTSDIAEVVDNFLKSFSVGPCVNDGLVACLDIAVHFYAYQGTKSLLLKHDFMGTLAYNKIDLNISIYPTEENED